MPQFNKLNVLMSYQYCQDGIIIQHPMFCIQNLCLLNTYIVVSNFPNMSSPFSVLLSINFKMFSLLVVAHVCPLPRMLKAPLRSHSTPESNTLKYGEL